MELVAEAFDALDESTRRRVHRWINDRYGDPDNPIDEEESKRATRDAVPAKSGVVTHTFIDLEALYVAAKTTAQWERALITGYWLQEIKRQEDFDALAVNQAMRQCGYSISNITRELSKLTATNMLVVLPSAEANGRRRFRVSRDGLRWSRRRLGQPET